MSTVTTTPRSAISLVPSRRAMQLPTVQQRNGSPLGLVRATDGQDPPPPLWRRGEPSTPRPRLGIGAAAGRAGIAGRGDTRGRRAQARVTLRPTTVGPTDYDMVAWAMGAAAPRRGACRRFRVAAGRVFDTGGEQVSDMGQRQCGGPVRLLRPRRRALRRSGVGVTTAAAGRGWWSSALVVVVVLGLSLVACSGSTKPPRSDSVPPPACSSSPCQSPGAARWSIPLHGVQAT